MEAVDTIRHVLNMEKYNIYTQIHSLHFFIQAYEYYGVINFLKVESNTLLLDIGSIKWFLKRLR